MSGRILITGGSGFIGRALARELGSSGYEIVAVTRGGVAARRRLPDGTATAVWDGRTAAGWGRLVDGARAVVNLAGDDLARGRWTRSKKARLLSSRVQAGAAVVEAVRAARTRPLVVVQASGVGFHGSAGETEIDEDSPAGTGFLAGVAREWEESSRAVESLGVRRVVLRSGLVLGSGGGAWPRLILPFRFFAGGPLGGGRQWFSWISLEDEVRAIRFLIEGEGLAGPFILAAPRLIRQREFCRVLGRALRRPCWAPVPSFLLRLLFGDKAGETLLVSQRARPRRLLAAGFEFRYPDAATAVAAILRSGSRGGSPGD